MGFSETIKGILRRWVAASPRLACLRDRVKSQLQDRRVRRRIAQTRELPDHGPMTGTFSVYQRYRQSGEPGGVILEAQPLTALPTGTMRELSGLKQHLGQPWPVFWCEVRNARLVGPTLVLINEAKEGSEESLYRPYGRIPSEDFEFAPPITRLSGRWMGLKMPWATGGNYCHWVCDTLPMLSYLRHLPSDTRLLVPEKLTAFQRESLEMLGLLDRARPTPETFLEVEQFYFTSPTAMAGCHNPYGIGFLRESYLPLVEHDPTLPERFYITRRSARRGVLNDEAIAEHFRSRGWGVVDTAAFTFRQQIALFAQAKAICGPHGAAFANLVWCQPGTKVLEIFAGGFLNGCYEEIAEEVGCYYLYRIYPADANACMVIDLPETAALTADW